MECRKPESMRQALDTPYSGLQAFTTETTSEHSSHAFIETGRKQGNLNTNEVRHSFPQQANSRRATLTCPKLWLPAWAHPQLRELPLVPVMHDTLEGTILHAIHLNQRLQRMLRATLQTVEVWLLDIVALRRDLEANIQYGQRARKQSCITSGEELFELNVTLNGIKLNVTRNHEKQSDALNTQSLPGNYFRTTKTCPAERASVQSAVHLACHDPLPNPDPSKSLWKILCLRVPPSFRKMKSWSAADDRFLMQGVHYFLHRLRLSSRQRKSLKEFAGTGFAELCDLLDFSSGIAVVWTDAESIVWRELVKAYLPGRLQDDCCLRWANCRDPRLEQCAFTDKEDNLLHELVQRGEQSTWEGVADCLSEIKRGQTKNRSCLRSATQCAGRYQAQLNQNLIRSTWTETDDSVLYRFVDRTGEGRWSEAVLILPGHTHAQALHRWYKVLTPGRRKGTWCNSEDIRLRLAVSAYAHVKGLEDVDNDESEIEIVTGRDTQKIQENRNFMTLPWSKISAHVTSRTDVQCRERWTNVLNPNLVRPATMSWSQKDDADLLDAVEEFATAASGTVDPHTSQASIIAWSNVARRLGRGLTDKMCRNRYKRILRSENHARALLLRMDT